MVVPGGDIVMDVVTVVEVWLLWLLYCCECDCSVCCFSRCGFVVMIGVVV